jgi:hypothetical protein
MFDEHRQSPAWPQTMSTVKIVVPVAPGGANDFLARLLVEHIGRVQGLAFTVENRTGAGGIISSAFSTYSTVSEQMNAGRLRALATGSPIALFLRTKYDEYARAIREANINAE